MNAMDNHYVPDLAIEPGEARAIEPRCMDEKGAPIRSRVTA